MWTKWLTAKTVNNRKSLSRYYFQAKTKNYSVYQNPGKPGLKQKKKKKKKTNADIEMNHMLELSEKDF